jgi:hypothetical protein
MVTYVNDKQGELLKIIDKLFSIYEDPVTEKKRIRVNPELTMDSLKDIISETRMLIVDLYLNCQKDYTKGVQMYEAIVDSLIASTVEKQIQKLEEEKIKLSSSSSNTSETS